MTSLLNLFLISSTLCLIQFVAALPWLWVADPDRFKAAIRNPRAWAIALGAVVVAGVALAVFMRFIGDVDRLIGFGRLFASVLHVQLAIDFFILIFSIMLLAWPRGGAVALAAFREGVRQPMFWLLVAIALGLIGFSLLLPYFTFGDDFKMVKSIGYDIIMLIAMVFAIIAAGWSISEEIEGRTAITLISKPLSRRGFLFGKYFGILLAAMVMTAVLGWSLNWALLGKLRLDPVDIAGTPAAKPDDPLAPTYDPIKAAVEPSLISTVQKVAPSGDASGFLRGIALWTAESLGHLPGLVVGFCQVMVLLAITSGLATRLPLVINLLAAGGMFLLGNLGPVLVQRSAEMGFRSRQDNPGQSSVTLDMINFVARLFDNVLPALSLFNLNAAIVRDTPLAAGGFVGYVASVFVYALLYSGIALLVGLILFEDRDLA